MARLTITEAADRLHVSPDSIRRRLRKGELIGTRDNRGQWWLDLPDDMQPEASALSVETRLAPAMLAPAQHKPMQPDPALVDALRGQVTDLTDRLNRAEVREAERQAVDDRRSRELTAALLRTAIAGTEARALREALEEARRPAWRRLFGRK